MAFRKLRKQLDPEIKVSEVNADINSREFARAVVGALRESLKGKG